jgi:hypothetical protein
MQIMKETGICWPERMLISRLYMDQSVKIRVDHGKTRNVKTGKGVRQEYCLSPILFNLQSEYLTYEALEGSGDLLSYMQMNLCYWLRKKQCYRSQLID